MGQAEGMTDFMGNGCCYANFPGVKNPSRGVTIPVETIDIGKASSISPFSVSGDNNTDTPTIITRITFNLLGLIPRCLQRLFGKIKE